jgi:hypothetical protein
MLEIVHDFEQVYGAQPVLSLDFNMVFFSAPADGRDERRGSFITFTPSVARHGHTGR